MISSIAISAFQLLFDQIGLRTCLPQEKFEEYGRDKHIDWAVTEAQSDELGAHF